MRYIRLTFEAEDSEFLCMRHAACRGCLRHWVSENSSSDCGSSGGLASGGWSPSTGGAAAGGCCCSASSPCSSVGGRGRNCLDTSRHNICIQPKVGMGFGTKMTQRPGLTFGKAGGSGAAVASAGHPPQVHCPCCQPHPSPTLKQKTHSSGDIK